MVKQKFFQWCTVFQHFTYQLFWLTWSLQLWETFLVKIVKPMTVWSFKSSFSLCLIIGDIERELLTWMLLNLLLLPSTLTASIKMIKQYQIWILVSNHLNNSLINSKLKCKKFKVNCSLTLKNKPNRMIIWSSRLNKKILLIDQY